MSEPMTPQAQGPAVQPGTQAGHDAGSGLYVRTWLWLLGLTIVEIAVASLSLPRGVTVGLLVVLALMKGALIMAYFMHLRFERLTFVYAVLSPLILAVALLAGIAPDAFTRLP
ncbi:cytochrome C oxidase subunit IV family protein [Limnochorda pilosa]|uniref:cytochrome C oxidase subunit IV family protein n=1 Tax=Limnochorda pilosa TaxID=1555112 RepID=UPI001187593D|nr:cytochrome C oxidase subunit IV family protein [Limnochorda pilosa]